ncbi:MULTISPECIES: Abi family protein [Myroides]|uniref:Abi family protein n=1 Tax=Myroides TaxID=76831 RepID=UPI0015F94D5E|nr:MULTISPECIES: Abi family protein [Myroides]MBB1138247.1 Abi family protein [Myroides sp. WP-1]MDM1037226.1 Abi family protein [Myroides odoratimimus]MDM1051303.1 Abi family protein [Myroides odoratimimus]MDM1083949.1 Abi family protein [Myroides odoratimimus]MDM1098280.1 Abi family protein [Myroides odoratimimus]
MGNIATSIDNQIEKLKSRGMILDLPLDKIKEVLLDIGYYRLGFYWNPFEIDDEHNFQEGIKFSTIIDLYYLDVDLRHLLIKSLNRIEVNYRTKIVYYVSNIHKTSPTWFVDPKVMTKDFINGFDKYYNTDFRKNNVINNHHNKHINDKYAPAWKTLEYLTFGINQKIYKNLLSIETKQRISDMYKVKDIPKFEKLMDVIVFVRNYCAHNGVIFDLRNTYGIPKLPYYTFNNNDRHCLDSCIKIIIFILSTISQNRADELKNNIDDLFNQYLNKGDEITGIITTKINYIAPK